METPKNCHKNFVVQAQSLSPHPGGRKRLPQNGIHFARQPQIQRHFLKSSISFQGPGVAAGEEDTRPCIILDYLVKNRMRMAAACARVAVPWGASRSCSIP